MDQKTKTLLMVNLLTLALYFSGFLVFLTPLPFIYYHLKDKKLDGLTSLWPSLLIVVAIYTFGIGFFNELYQSLPWTRWLVPIPVIELINYFSHTTVQIIGLCYFASYVAMGFLIVKALKLKQTDMFRYVLYSIIGIFVIGGLISLALVYPQSEAIVTAYREYIAAGINEIIKSQEQAGLTLSQLVELKSQLPAMINYSMYLLPFIFMLTLCGVFVLNLIVAKRYFKKVYEDMGKINLSEFKIPFHMVWVAVGLVIVMLANKKILGSDGIHFVVLNFLLTIGVAYFFQGLAVMINFLDRKQVVGFMRVLFYFGLLFMVLFMVHAVVLLIAALGFVDNWADMRRLEQNARAARS